MDTGTINEVSDKVIDYTKTSVKDHPGITALLSLGISWFTLYMLLKPKTPGERIVAQLQEAEQKAESTLSDFGEKAKDTGETVSEKAGSMFSGVSGYMDENPVTFGLIGLSAGLILGFLTSGVLGGNDFLDETRRTVAAKTRQILKDTTQKAGHVLNAAREAARGEAERQDLLPH